MKLIYTVEELQSVPPTSNDYGTVLQVLARLGALEVVQSPERKEKLEKEVAQLISKVYLPKVGDVLSYEDHKTGMRYKCLVNEVRPDGWLMGEPCSFHPRHWLLLDVLRGNKQIYRW